MKSVSRAKGMTIDGLGGVSGRSRDGPSLALVRFKDPQLTRRVIENNIGQTVYYSGFETGVGVTKRYRGRHCKTNVLLSEARKS